MINIVFSKMEAFSGNFGISLNKLQSKNSLIPGGSRAKPPSVDDGELSHKNLSDKSLQIRGSIIPTKQSSQISVTEPSFHLQSEEEKDSHHLPSSMNLTEGNL